MSEPQYRHLQCHQEAGILVLTLSDRSLQGDELVEHLRQDLFAAVDHFATHKLVIDFQHVEHLSSAGFRPLLSLFRKLQDKHGRMVFCNLAHDVAEVFLVTRLISSSRSSTAPFELARDVPDAVARLRHHIPYLEKGVLVLTITEKELRGDELAGDLGQELLASVARAGVNKVVLDMQQVVFLSTPCLRPMLALRSHVRNQNGHVALCNLDPKVAEVLTVTRLVAHGGTGPVTFETAADAASAISLLLQKATAPA